MSNHGMGLAGHTLRCLLFLLVVVACQPAYRLEPRFVAVHNAMSAMGLGQTGPIAEGSLLEGDEIRFSRKMDAGRCYVLLALGHDGVRDVDVQVVDQAGEEIGKDSSRDGQAVVRACPARTGVHSVLVRAVEGSGEYAVAMWSTSIATAPFERTTPQSGESVRGTCGAPIDIDLGQTLEGDTRQGLSNIVASCATGNAAEQVFRIQVDRVTQISALAKTTFDGAVYVQRECGNRESELVCNDDSPNSSRSRVDATLKPGTYFIVVDGYGAEGGAFELSVQGSALQSVEAVCKDAQLLPFGRTRTGSTLGSADYFQASCASGSRSSDRVFRLKVTERSRVRVGQQTDHDGAIYMRTKCSDAKSEVACNDDFRNPRNALIKKVLDPGDYYVFVDGFAPDQAGKFSLLADKANPDGESPRGDRCETAVAVDGPANVVLDTLRASNAGGGSCGGAGGPDLVREIRVNSKSRVRITVKDSEFTGHVYLRRECDVRDSEMSCDAVSTTRPLMIDRVLEAGRYFLFLDGAGEEEFGRASLEVRIDDMKTLAKACRTATRLRPGVTVSGRTSGREDLFQATCAGSARSGDRVYEVRVPRRSLVKFSLSADYDSSLHLRQGCLDGSTIIACNDDHGDARHSRIMQILERGTYYLVVDGFRTGNEGSYELDMEMLRVTAAPSGR